MPHHFLKSRQVLELAFMLRDAESIEQLEKKFLQEIRSIYADKSFYISSDEPAQYSIPINKDRKTFGYLVIPDSYKTDIEAREDFGMLCFLLAEMITVNKEKKESQKLKSAMIESEERYRLLTENAKDVVFKIRVAEYIFEYISPSVEVLFGIKQAEIYRSPSLVEALLPPGWEDYFTRNWEDIDRGVLADFYDYPIIHNQTKKLHWLHQRNDWIWDENGTLVALQGRIEDITERKIAEQKLKENEKRYEKAQFMGQVGNWEYDLLTQKIWVSAEFKRIFGFDLELNYFRTEQIEKCIPARERVHQALGDLLQKEKEYNLEYDIITEDKSERKTIQSIAELVRDSEDKPLKVTGVVKDITQLKLKKLALEKSENKFRSIYEQSPIAIELFNRDGKLIDLNPNCLEMFGVDDPKYVLGFHLWDDPTLTARVIDKLKSGEEVEFSTEFDFDVVKAKKLYPTSRSGKIYMDIFAIPLKSGSNLDENDIDGFLLQIIEITERKNYEKRILEERNRAENYLKIAGVILLSINVDGIVTMINPKGCQVLGYESKDIVGKNWVKNYVPVHIQSKVNNIFKQISDGRPELFRYFENCIITKNGEERLISWNNSDILDDDGNTVGVLCSGLDITEIKKTEEELLKNREMLQEAQALGKMGNWNIDLNTGQVTGSRETKRIYGISEKESITTEETQQCHLLEYREQLEKSLAELIQFGKPYDLEFKLKKADSGEIIDVQSMAEYNREKNIISGIIQDITERKKTELALRESEEKFRALYDNAPLSYQSLNEDGTFQDINPTWLNTLGYKRNEVIGKNFADFLHPDWKEHFEVNFPAFKKRGYVSEVEFRVRHKNGSYIDISFEGCIGYHPDGSFHQTYCVFKDITEQKQAELALMKSEERYRGLVETISSGVTVYKVLNRGENGRDYIIQDYNKMALDMKGLRKKDVVGKALPEIMINIDDYGLIPVFKSVWETGKAAFYPAKIYRDDKHVNYYENRVFRIPSGEIVAVFDDVTQSKKSELELQESEERYHTLFQNTDEGIIIANSDNFHFEYANPAICKILGYSFDEIIKLSVSDIHPENTVELAKSQFKKLALKEIDSVNDFPFKRKDGETIYMDCNASLIKIKGESKIAGFFKDITERKLADEELTKHREHLEELVQERTKELEFKNTELERFNKLFVGREFRIKELREKVKKLEIQLDPSNEELT